MKGLSIKQLCLAASTLVASLGLSSAANADLLEEIKQRGEIVIATEARYAPFELLEDGKITGYHQDMLMEILTDLPDVKLKQLDLPFQGIMAGLTAKRYDFVVTSLTITKARAAKYNFTYPTSTASVAVLKRKGDERIVQPQDMAGKVLGIQAGAPQVEVAKEYEQSVVIPEKGEGYKDIKLFTDYNEAYSALASRRVDAVPQALSNLAPIVKERGDLFEIVQPAFGPATYYAWAGRDDAESESLVAFFSEGIEKLQQSGKLDELQMKWFGFTMEVPQGMVPAPVN